MPHTVSWTFRTSANSQATDEVPVVLVEITHPDIDGPIRLSSDPTERLAVEPLTYGTKHLGNDYLFVLMSAIPPDDQKDGPPKSTLVFENIDADMVKLMRSFRSPCSVDLKVVLASNPDAIEVEYTDLLGTKATFDAAQVSMDISREPFTSEPCPYMRFTWERAPGLHVV